MQVVWKYLQGEGRRRADNINIGITVLKSAKDMILYISIYKLYFSALRFYDLESTLCSHPNIFYLIQGYLAYKSSFYSTRIAFAVGEGGGVLSKMYEYLPYIH